MKGRKWWKITLTVLVAVAVAGGVLAFFLTRQPTKEVTVVPVGNIYTSYWGDSKTLDGYVTTGSMQEVYMTEEGFDKVAVKEGDRVRKGDVLVEYDNTQAQLMLKGDQAKINLLKSQIAAFEKQIKESYLKISTLESALAGKPDTPPAGDDSAVTPPPAPVLTAQDTLSDISHAVNFGAAGVGTPEVPYRFLCTRDGAVTTEFWKSFPSTAYHCIVDIYTDTNCSQWVARWTINTTFVTTPQEVWKVTDGLHFDSDTGDIIGFDGTKLFPYGALTLRMPQDLIEKIPVGEDTEEVPKTKAEIEAEIKALREEIDNCNRQMNTTQQELRQAQITYEKNKMTYTGHEIRSSIDGVVATLGDAATPIGEVFLRVQGESRFAVTLYVNELMLRDITIGTEVQLMCYESGTMASAVITEIGTEPVPNYYSGGNSNASTYQVTAEISDPEAQPRLGEWCQATLDGQMPDEPADTIYLPLFVIREDEGGEYVMRADEKEQLQKQYITTGKSLWGSYVEIKEGVTMEDRLAFPYGKAVREGAPVVDGQYFE